MAETVAVELSVAGASAVVLWFVAVSVAVADSTSDDVSFIEAALAEVSLFEEAAVELSDAGVSVAEALALVATAVVAAGADCEATAFVVAAPAALAGDPAGWAAVAREFVSDGGWLCGWSNSYNFCSNAARAAAWSGLSSAWTEKQLATTAAHKIMRILVFIKMICLPLLCEHLQGQFGA